MLKLKLRYFGHLMWRADSLEKTLMLGKIEGRRRRGQQRMRCLDGITDSVDMNLSKFWKMMNVRAAVHGITKTWTLLSNWIATSLLIGFFCCAHDLSSCLKSALFLVLFPNLNWLTLAWFLCSDVSSLPNSYAAFLIYSTDIYWQTTMCQACVESRKEFHNLIIE